MPARLDAELAALAERLRRVTVRLQIGGAGEGCGIVWRPDGLVVTNAHVAGGRTARVRLEDGATFEGRVLARDPSVDLAVLAIAARGLIAASLGDTAALRPGELIVALGHPLGVANAVSLGVVHEVVREPDGTPRWVAADLRLAPGNSGGPLAGADGRVVGINTLVAGGLGYALPVPLIARFLRRAGLASPDERAA
ncbi:MAG: S1C family serine protease [Gemmatimonadales bacterium]